MDSNYIPANYQEWKYCITVLCGIPLSRDFVANRIALFSDKSKDETKKFIQTYGERHAGQVLDWFVLAKHELENN